MSYSLSPTLTNQQVGFGSALNVLTSSLRLTFDDSNRLLKVGDNVGAVTLRLEGVSNASALRVNGGDHPGDAGGVVLGFVGGGQSDAPGLWWSNNAYNETSGLWLNFGFNFQGAGSAHSPVKIRQGTGTSANGNIIFEFRPDSGYAAINPYGTGAGNTTELRFYELTASGSNYFGLKAPNSLASDRTLVFPSDDPAIGDGLRVTAFSGGIISTEFAPLASVANIFTISQGGVISGPVFTLVPPTLGNFTAINQGTATATTVGSGIYVVAPATASGENLRIWDQAIPAAPYTVTLALIPMIWEVNYHEVGICLRDSVGGRVVTFSCYSEAASLGSFVRGLKWFAPNSAASSYSQVRHSGPSTMFFLRIQDDGTNRVTSCSRDGQNFYQIDSVSNTDWLTPDRIGFFVRADNPTYSAAMTVLSWQVA